MLISDSRCENQFARIGLGGEERRGEDFPKRIGKMMVLELVTRDYKLGHS